MKQRFGALLCILLGVVLIVGGISGGTSGTIGSPVPTCIAVGSVTPQCPTGTITISETTVGTGATPPSGGWLVHITSPNCTDPSGDTVAMDVAVPTGASAASGALLIFTSLDHTTSCSYALTEQAVADTTATFDPASPETIPFTINDQTANNLPVALTNTFAAPTSTTTTTTSAAPSSSTAAPTSASESAPSSDSALPTAVTRSSSASASSSTAPVLATTGTSTPISATTIAGIALCLFGLVLLFAGRRRPRASRHN